MESLDDKERFSCKRDEVLYQMSRAGWANASSGDAESPTGLFSRISNTPEEMPELLQAFTEVLAGADDDSIASLQGHFLLIEDRFGYVGVDEYETQDELLGDYIQLDLEYMIWAADSGKPS